jgi:protein-disulfide isomerase
MSTLKVPIGPDDHLLGDAGAPVVLLEYGDYECPYCAHAHLVVKEVARSLGSDLCFVYRHFPLSEVHPHALDAAEAAEAAAAQETFWPMHATLFENQDALEPEDLLQYAVGLGLDLARFQRDLATHAHSATVKRDFMSGVRSGVNGTPTFFIDGTRHDGSWDVDTLTEALRAAARTRRRAG